MRLRDFGVASSAHPGRFSYLSPEANVRRAANHGDRRVAVGVMLFETLAGSHPFQEDGASAEQMMSAIRSGR